MEKNIAISSKNVSKQYRLGEIGTGTLSHDLNRWWHKLRGKPDPYSLVIEENDRSAEGKSDYVWALNDINFEVKNGEVLGIIGKNGAGKSTLLKVLSKVTGPTTGEIKMRGRVASLLEVGTGFHPELTGRENIFLNGAILGMTREEVNQKLEEIVEFSGVKRYLDTPVKRYSSGMKVRLGFAVAAHLEPEILIVDEVLAVGDAEFQKRAVGKMQEVSDEGGRTVLFVSHNMVSIRNLCQRAIVLDKGKVVFDGDVNAAIDYYLNNTNDNIAFDGHINWSYDEAPGDDDLKLLSVSLSDSTQNIKSVFRSDEEIKIDIHYEITKDLNNMRFNIQILTNEEQVVFATSTHDYEDYKKSAGKYVCSTKLPANFFNNKSYKVLVQAGITGVKQLLKSMTVLEFQIEKVTGSGSAGEAHLLPGITAPNLIWEIDKTN